MKYLVMECHLSHAVVLGDDGKFLKVANMRYEVGQTVENVVPMVVPEATATPKSRWLTPLASLAACLVLIAAMMFFRAPYASVYLTINPEVRIDVNRSDVVVAVEGVNADGVDLLEGYDYQKKDLDLVMDELVDRAISMGYLSDGGTVTLTLEADDAWVVEHTNALSTHLNEYLTEKVSVTIEIAAPAYHDIEIPGDTDYGDTDYGTVPPTAPTAPTDGPATDYSDDGVTDYGDGSGNGDDVTDDDGDSDYNEDDPDDGDSGYDDDEDSDDDD